MIFKKIKVSDKHGTETMLINCNLTYQGRIQATKCENENNDDVNVCHE